MRENFSSTSPAHTLRTMTIVGGEYKAAGILCDNDRISRYHALKMLKAFGVVMDGSFDIYDDVDCADVLSSNMDVLNIDEQHDGRDFLKARITSDVLMFANLSYRLSEQGSFMDPTEETLTNENGAILRYRDVFERQSSVRVSDQNSNEVLWNQQVRASGAKIVIVVGGCDFPPEKLVGNDFVMLKNTLGTFPGILVQRDYLKDMKPYWKNQKHPLAVVAELAGTFTDIKEFSRRNVEIAFDPVMPQTALNLRHG